MIKEKSPKCGYDTDEKQKYRDKIYYELLHDCRFGGVKENEKIFIMPSIDGSELKYLIKDYDYPEIAMSINRWPIFENQIIVCNNNPAIVATLKRKYPKIKTFGIDVFKALKKINIETDKFFNMYPISSDFYRIVYFNFDLCGTAATAVKLAEKIHDEIPDILVHDAIVAFTFLNGRDQKGSIPQCYLKTGRGFYYRANAIMRALQFGKQWRKYVRRRPIYNPNNYEVYLREYGRYLSGGTLPMGWVLFKIRRGGRSVGSIASEFNRYGESELISRRRFDSVYDWRLRFS